MQQSELEASRAAALRYAKLLFPHSLAMAELQSRKRFTTMAEGNMAYHSLISSLPTRLPALSSHRNMDSGQPVAWGGNTFSNVSAGGGRWQVGGFKEL